MTAISREKLARTVQTLEAAMMERITEGLGARVNRYFTDKTLLKKLIERRAKAS